MPRFTPICLLLANGFLINVTSSVSAGMVVLAGGGGAQAYDYEGNVTDGVSWNQPGSNTVTAQWRELYAHGAFDFATNNESLTLSFDSIHSVRRTTQEFHSEMNSSVGGGFWFMSNLDVLVSVSGEMTFSLHGQEDPGAGMFIQIANQNQDTIHQMGVTSNYGPLNGTINLFNSVLLDGETQYFVFVSSDVSQSAVGLSDLPSTAFSEMTLTIQTIPEPATMLLFVIGSLVGLRRYSSP